ncbi:MAG: MlaD family protein [Fimbriimonadales bacterium]
MQSAWKVGLFVVVFVILLFTAYSIVGNALLKKPTRVFYAEFEDVQNVQAGAMVSMAGVRIGQVEEVKLAGPTKAVLTLAINEDVQLPSDAFARVPSSLLSIGEQRVEIGSKSGGGSLSPGTTIVGVKSSFLDTMLPDAKTTISLLNANLEATHKLFGDEGLKAKLDAILASSDKTITELGELFAEAKTVVRGNQGTLKQVLLNASSAVSELRSGIQAVNKIVADPKTGEEVQALLHTLNSTASRAEELVGTLSRSIEGLDLKTSIQSTLSNVDKITGTGVEIAENAKEISAQGKVLTDRMVELVGQAKEIATEAKELVGKLNKYADKLGTDIKVPKIQASLETGRNLERNRFQTDIYAKYPLDGNRFLVGGIYDATESNKIVAQYGQPLGPASLRYGIFASKPGVGVDFPLSSKLWLGADLFDPNSPKLNMRARLNFGEDWFGWVGADNLFKRVEPKIGIGIRR